MVLALNSTTLRPFEERDLGFLWRSRNDLLVEAASQPTEPVPITPAVFRSRFDAGMSAVSSGGPGDLEWVITRSGDGEGEPLGIAGLYGIDRFNRNAEMGVTIASPSHRGAGIGIDSYLALAQYAFRSLGLHKVQGCFKGSNVAGLGTCARLGLTQDGVLREHRWENGAYVDLHIYRMLASQWSDELIDWRTWERPSQAA